MLNDEKSKQEEERIKRSIERKARPQSVRSIAPVNKTKPPTFVKEAEDAKPPTWKRADSQKKVIIENPEVIKKREEERIKQQEFDRQLQEKRKKSYEDTHYTPSITSPRSSRSGTSSGSTGSFNKPSEEINALFADFEAKATAFKNPPVAKEQPSTAAKIPKVDLDLSELDELLIKSTPKNKDTTPREQEKIVESIKVTTVEAHPEKSAPVIVSELDNLISSMSPKSKDTTVEKDLDDLKDIANSRRSRREQEKKTSRN